MVDISKGREYDRTNRVLIMENMGVMMRMYARTGEARWLERAKEFGDTARNLSERIKNHNYSEIDSEYERMMEMDAEASRLWKEIHS